MSRPDKLTSPERITSPEKMGDDALEASLTFPRLFARQSYWREFPPTHVLARAIAVGMGVFKPVPPPRDAMATLKAMFPEGKI